MALVDDIAAVRDDPNLDEDQKRAAIYALKVDGIVSRISSFAGQSTTYESVTYQLRWIRSITVKGVLQVEIGVTRTRSGRTEKARILLPKQLQRLQAFGRAGVDVRKDALQHVGIDARPKTFDISQPLFCQCVPPCLLLACNEVVLFGLQLGNLPLQDVVALFSLTRGLAARLRGTLGFHLRLLFLRR